MLEELGMDLEPRLKTIFTSETYKFIEQEVDASRYAIGFAAKLEQNFDWLEIEKSHDHALLVNSYIDAVLACTMGKHGLIGESIINSLNRMDFLTFSLLARSNFELVASLRYLMKKRVLPFVLKASKTGSYRNEEIVSGLIEPLHGFMMGGRFDWASWYENEGAPWSLLAEKYEKHRKNKSKNKPASPWSDGMAQPVQINIKTQIEDWAKEEPVLGAYYDVLCDLVHPNLGSNLLFAEFNGSVVNYRNREHERTLGCRIVERVLPLHMSIKKQFGKDIELLIHTKMND